MDYSLTEIDLISLKVHNKHYDKFISEKAEFDIFILLLKK